MIPEYSVFINNPYKRIKSIAVSLIAVAFLGIGLTVFIEPFVFLITGPLNSEGLWYVMGGLTLIGITGFLLMFVKKNTTGTLKIYEDSIVIISINPLVKISFKDLKRIGFIVSTFSFNPYKIEFISPDYQFTRVRLKTKEEFYEIMAYLYEVTPENLPKEVFSNEFLEI